MTFDPKNVKKQLANHILADGFDPIIDLETVMIHIWLIIGMIQNT